MQVFFFFYNIIATVAFLLCGIYFLLVYKLYGDKAQKMCAFVFFLFFCDNLVLFMYEFLPQFASYYQSVVRTQPYISSFLALAIIYAYRETLLSFEERKMGNPEIGGWLISVVLVFATSTLYSHLWAAIAGDTVQCALAVWVYAAGLYWLKRNGSYRERAALPRIKAWFLWLGMAFEILVFIEKYLSIYGIYLLMPSRYLGIELISVLFVFCVFAYAARNQLQHNEIKAANNDETKKDRLAAFALCYGLTQRETEITKLLVNGNSNGDICRIACISEGTVKSHTHNIYRKLDIKNRVALMNKFKEYEKSRE